MFSCMDALGEMSRRIVDSGVSEREYRIKLLG